MSINKFIKRFKLSAQWSPMIITACLYILFIMVVLSISFPLKSHRKSKFNLFESERKNSIGFMSNHRDNDVNDNGNDDDDRGDGKGSDDDNDANRLGDNEHRLLQRAHNLPRFSNRTNVLRDAFQR